MARALVCYGSSEGQTAAVAERIGDVLDDHDHEVTLVNLKHPPDGFSPSNYDGVVVGASVHAGSHQPYVAHFVRDHREELSQLPSAFVSVSLSAAHADEAERAPAREMLEAFLDETGWAPDETLTVAGALKYSQYGLLKRFAMKRIAGKASGDTDTSRDYEYTDWEALEAFADEFAALLESSREE
ncbi:protoporphyrinogen oxidase [Halobacteria archaeon AArc-m2/3/4]|uniref:Protoporphyrinogen oxidase n=1 Tax=Natronoglomus mannanivorans TaxID=2979990 RepID=A0AAP3E3A6_9EURY|nr:protoporphyrinogen oxidase [Halobacteria archaeon AArc-xg1-1]MCU4972845.1 protoporphyrinogen oxidase [Halobacteria archaeon AArc-m2/3/4]